MRYRRTLAITVGLCVAALVAAVSVAAASVSATPKCDGVRLRSGPSTAYATRLIIDRGTRVTVVAEVKDAAWSTLCGGGSYSGSKWAQVSAVDGVTVKSRFGLEYLYAAAGLLRDLGPVATTAATAAPSPMSQPSIAPTVAPSETPEPTATPEPSRSAAPPPSPTTSPLAPASAASSPRPMESAGQAGDPAGPTSDIGTAMKAAILVLALASTALSIVVYAQRRRDERSHVSKVPRSRLDDVKS
jgi:uncharacterized protein YraI